MQKCTPPGPEGHLRVRLAADVEAVRVVEDRLVEVARDVPGGDFVVLADLLAVQLCIGGGGAAKMVHRGRPAEDLAGGERIQVWVRAQPFQLFGVVDQRQQPLGDRVAGGLVAGDREQQEVDVELVLGQRAAVDLGLDQLADDVVAGALAALVGELLAEGEHLERGRV